jgi:hypothetical protein
MQTLRLQGARRGVVAAARSRPIRSGGCIPWRRGAFGVDIQENAYAVAPSHAPGRITARSCAGPGAGRPDRESHPAAECAGRAR